MTRVLALGLGVGAGIQGFRQWPPDGPVTMNAAIALFLVGLLAAYFGGRRGRQGSSAVAIATASAEASGNVVNVQLFQPGAHAAEPRSVFTTRVPEPDSVPWLTTPSHAAIEHEMFLDGVDLEDIGLRELND